MSKIILRLEIRLEQDIVLARQQSRELARLLGFDSQDQTRIATAVSEISRNAFNYAGGGEVEFLIEEAAQTRIFLILIRDKGPGLSSAVMGGRYGQGRGILGAGRLMDRFQIESTPGQGTSVWMGKNLPSKAPFLAEQDLLKIADEVRRRLPQGALKEIQQQNQELLRVLADLQKRQQELVKVNKDLDSANRGVRSLYAELGEKTEQLRLAYDLKSRFISNMSHEFRTPLNSILSLSRFLLDRVDGELTPEQEKQLSFIHQSAENLLEMVNDLLDLARLESGKVAVNPSEFKVSTLFEALRGVMKPLATNTKLIFDDPLDLPVLHTDENKVAQILRNLISNALKFTEHGEVRVSASLDKEAVVFSVTDTGLGIAAEHQQRIFEEYAQLKTTHSFKGTGLGLPISRKLARMLGGDLFLVKSQPGVGSTFSAIIPIAYKEQAVIKEKL